MRGAPLLRPHLDDAVVAAGGVDHHAPFADRQRERLLDVDVLAGLARHDGRDRVPVIGGADDDGVDVLAIEHTPEIARRERRRLVVILLDAIGGLRDLLIVYIAQCHALRAQAQRGAQVCTPLAAAADERHADAPVGAGHAVLGRGPRQGRRARR